MDFFKDVHEALSAAEKDDVNAAVFVFISNIPPQGGGSS
jgi:hypothetical protein